jgi:hypothetical protein
MSTSTRFLHCAAFILALTACSQSEKQDSPAPAASDLKQALSVIEGEFARYANQDGLYYTKQNEARDTVIALSPQMQGDTLPDNRIAELIDCIDDPSPSLSKFEGNFAPVGWVCHFTLRGFVIHEETDAEGDITSWDGYPQFPASQQEMRAAKSAWQKVFADKTYY